jgi:hypothetical protein
MAASRCTVGRHVDAAVASLALTCCATPATDLDSGQAPTASAAPGAASSATKGDRSQVGADEASSVTMVVGNLTSETLILASATLALRA